MPCDSRDQAAYEYPRAIANLTRLLCEALTLLGNPVIEQHGSSGLKEWKAEHDAADAREAERVLHDLRMNTLQAQAWDKLTPDERAALGMRNR